MIFSNVNTRRGFLGVRLETIIQKSFMIFIKMVMADGTSDTKVTSLKKTLVDFQGDTFYPHEMSMLYIFSAVSPLYNLQEI